VILVLIYLENIERRFGHEKIYCTQRRNNSVLRLKAETQDIPPLGPVSSWCERLRSDDGISIQRSMKGTLNDYTK